VVITCKEIAPLVPLQCSFSGGPLHSCTLPLVLTSDVSPAGRHSVRIVTTTGAEDTVSYTISDTTDPICKSTDIILFSASPNSCRLLPMLSLHHTCIIIHGKVNKLTYTHDRESMGMRLIRFSRIDFTCSVVSHFYLCVWVLCIYWVWISFFKSVPLRLS
jgi:hypothetical protein